MADQDIEELSPEEARDAATALAVNVAFQEALQAKTSRIEKSRVNRDVFYGRQDFSHKTKGQSREVLPKVANSVESMAAFMKRGLVQAGDWFTITLDKSLEQVVRPEQVRTILMHFLDNLATGNNNTTTFPVQVSDGVKNALLESLMIAKVHGRMVDSPRFVASRKKGKERLKRENKKEWRLAIDIIPPENYFPDPSGSGLYEIHHVEKDLHEVIAMSEGDDAVYDPEVVKKIRNAHAQIESEADRTDTDRNQDEVIAAARRKKVLITEYWGTILNPDGSVFMENAVCAIANHQYVIRKPEPNPFWHQERPFVAVPLMRVPWSVWHRALYDDVAELNLAINELFNLILDGGVASVWGVRQVRVEDLENPAQVAQGLAANETLLVKNTLPHGQKVAETVTTGNVPRDAMAVFQTLNAEFAQAALTNELRQGSFPDKQVRATEVVEAGNSQNVVLDGIVSDIEDLFINRILWLSWMTILQNMDKVPEGAMDDIIDAQVARLLEMADPEDRFALFAGKTKFKANGISGTLSKAMTFQKFMALMQAVSTNPILMQAFLNFASGNKALISLMRMINFNPDEIEMSQEERAKIAQTTQQVGALSGLQEGGAGASAAGAPGAPPGAPQGGGSETPAQINQLAQPLTGLTPNA